MAEIKDLDRCNYFPFENHNLIAVGWLSDKTKYRRSEVNKDFYHTLRQLVKAPWEPVTTMGFHSCELCQFNPPNFKKNAFIPYSEKIYVCPEAITHYIAAHWYKPPQIFIDAVMNCPPMRSMEYKKSILRNGGRGLASIKEQIPLSLD